jgi:hypothetical protein
MIPGKFVYADVGLGKPKNHESNDTVVAFSNSAVVATLPEIMKKIILVPWKFRAQKFNIQNFRQVSFYHIPYRGAHGKSLCSGKVRKKNYL